MQHRLMIYWLIGDGGESQSNSHGENRYSNRKSGDSFIITRNLFRNQETEVAVPILHFCRCLIGTSLRSSMTIEEVKSDFRCESGWRVECEGT